MPEKNLVVVNEWNGKFLINEAYRPIAQALCLKFSNLYAMPENIVFIDDTQSSGLSQGRRIFAKTGKVPPLWSEAIEQMTSKNFTHFIIFYKNNTDMMSREQIVALVYHELRHIDSDGAIAPHDIEDWANMIDKLGPMWAITKANIPNLLDESIINWDSIKASPNLFPAESKLQVVK